MNNIIINVGRSFLIILRSDAYLTKVIFPPPPKGIV